MFHGSQRIERLVMSTTLTGMKRDVFLAGADVEGFLTWIAPRLSGDRAFTHEWQSPRFGHWSCTSIYDAFQNYTWPFSATLPGDSEPTRGRTFAENLDA